MSHLPHVATPEDLHVGPGVVIIGSLFEETPEALFRSDRIARAYDDRRAALTPAQRELEDVVEAQVSRAILGV